MCRPTISKNSPARQTSCCVLQEKNICGILGLMYILFVLFTLSLLFGAEKEDSLLLEDTTQNILVFADSCLMASLQTKRATAAITSFLKTHNTETSVLCLRQPFVCFLNNISAPPLEVYLSSSRYVKSMVCSNAPQLTASCQRLEELLSSCDSWKALQGCRTEVHRILLYIVETTSFTPCKFNENAPVTQNFTQFLYEEQTPGITIMEADLSLEDTEKNREFLRMLFGAQVLNKFLETHTWDTLKTQNGVQEIIDLSNEKTAETAIPCGVYKNQKLAWQQIFPHFMQAIPSTHHCYTQKVFDIMQTKFSAKTTEPDLELRNLKRYDMFMVWLTFYLWDELQAKIDRSTLWLNQNPVFFEELFDYWFNNWQKTPISPWGDVMKGLEKSALASFNAIDRDVYFIPAPNTIYPLHNACWAMQNKSSLVGIPFGFPIEEKELSAHGGMFVGLPSLFSHDSQHGQEISKKDLPSSLFPTKKIVQCQNKQKPKTPFVLLIIKAIGYNDITLTDKEFLVDFLPKHFFKETDLNNIPHSIEASIIASLAESCKSELVNFFAEDIQLFQVRGALNIAESTENSCGGLDSPFEQISFSKAKRLFLNRENCLLGKKT